MWDTCHSRVSVSKIPPFLRYLTDRQSSVADPMRAPPHFTGERVEVKQTYWGHTAT